MKRIDHLVQKLASAAIHLAPLAFIVGFLAAPRNVHAVPICYGGSIIYDSTHSPVGCAFATWGPSEQSMCSGATVFAPADSGCGNMSPLCGRSRSRTDRRRQLHRLDTSADNHLEGCSRRADHVRLFEMQTATHRTHCLVDVR